MFNDPISIFLSHLGNRWSQDQSWKYHIDIDLIPAKLPGHTLCQANDPRLGGTVTNRGNSSTFRINGRKVDDFAVAIFNHMGGNRLDTAHGSLQVNIQDRIPILLFHFQKGGTSIEAS